MRYPSLVHDHDFQDAAHVAVRVEGKSQQEFAEQHGCSIGTVNRALAARRARTGEQRQEPKLDKRKTTVRFHSMSAVGVEAI